MTAIAAEASLFNTTAYKPDRAGPAQLEATTSPQQDEPLDALDFLNVVSLSKALRTNNWTLAREIETYIDIASDCGVAAKDRILALRQLRSIIRENADLHGYIQKATLTARQGDLSMTVDQRRLSQSTDQANLIRSLAGAGGIIDDIPKQLETTYVNAQSEEVTDIHGGLAHRPDDDARLFDPTATAASRAVEGNPRPDPDDGADDQSDYPEGCRDSDEAPG